MPLVRRLDFEYPEYESAARNDQYLLGEDILIAPTITDTEGGDPAVPAEWLTTPDGEPGLKAEFFNNKNLEGEPVAVKTVDNINFDWGKDSPAFGVNDGDFSIRFTARSPSATRTSSSRPTVTTAPYLYQRRDVCRFLERSGAHCAGVRGHLEGRRNV